MSDPAPANDTPHVLIIGGGIAGLASALRIRALDRRCRITVVDASTRLGGKIDGAIVDGCVVDGGADVCIGEKLRTTHMFSALALDSRIIRVNPNNLPTFEYHNGALQRLPASFSGELLTFRTGMREIVDVTSTALASSSSATNTLKASIASLHSTANRWRADSTAGASYAADAVVIATPADSAAALLSSVAPAALAPGAAAYLRTLEYPPTTTVTMGWRRMDVPHALDGTGYLAPDSAPPVTACTWVSSKNPAHAPPDMALLRGYIRGSGTDAATLMRNEVARVLCVTAAPIFTRIYEWPCGIPAYPEGHRARVRELEEQIADVPGLFIAGAAFHGVGIPDCIHSGERAADAVVSYLAARQSEEAA